MHTGSARLTIFLNKFTESGPSIITADEINCFVLARVSGKDVVMLIVQNMELKVTRVRDVNEIVMKKESIRGDGPMRFRIFGKGK